MADYGFACASGGEARPPRELFNQALIEVGRSALAVQNLAEELRTSPAAISKDSVEHQKLAYISMQMGFYEGIVDTLTAKDAQLQRDLAMGRRQQAHQQVMANRVYHEMNQILCSLDAGFLRMLVAPDGQFQQLYRACTVWLQRNPKKAMAALPVGGAVIGSSFAAFHYKFGWCLLGMHAQECSVAVAGKAILASGAAGFAIGVVLVGIGLGVWWAMGRLERESCHLRQFEDEQRRRLESMVEELKRMSEDQTLETFRALTNICRASFCQMEFHPGDDVCSMCLEEIGGPQDAVRSPNCRDRHFLHANCWEAYVRGLSTQECPICRV